MKMRRKIAKTEILNESPLSLTLATISSFLLSLAVILIFTSSPVCSLEQGCGPECLSCTKTGCVLCYKRFILKDPKTGNTHCSESRAPPHLHCDTFSAQYKQGKHCFQCSAGHIATRSQICKPIKIPRCDLGVELGSIQYCLVCDFGMFPGHRSDSCWPVSKLREKYPKNCLKGGRDAEGLQCDRCLPGYMLSSELQPTCVRQTLKGCYKAENGEVSCKACDAWRGFFMVSSDGVCTELVSVASYVDGVEEVSFGGVNGLKEETIKINM